MLLEFWDEKKLCVAKTWFRKGEKRKVTYSAGENKTEIDFVLVEKGNRKYLRDVKVIPSLDEWALSVVVPIFKGKGDALSCGAYNGVRTLEHAMKILEKVLERRLWTRCNLVLCQEKE